MLASRHAVFVGPGRLPRELRDVLLRRAGQPQPDLTIQAPRLLALFDNAVDAERIAAQLQRLHIGALVAGPEQPPVEDAWFVARQLELFAGQWRFTLASQDTRTLNPGEVTGVAIVDWRPQAGGVDRGVLVRTPQLDRPLFLRASVLDPASSLLNPVDGLKRINELLDDLALAMPEQARRVSRRLGPEDLFDLEGDKLPLAVAMVDALDVHQAQLSVPLGRAVTPMEAELVLRTGTARVAAVALLAQGGLLALGFAAMAIVGGVAAIHGNVSFLAASIAVLAAAMVKTAWGRWLARYAFERPLALVERLFRYSGGGWRPRAAHLAFDVIALAAVAAVRTSLPTATPIADVVLALLGVGLVPTAAALVAGRE